MRTLPDVKLFRLRSGGPDIDLDLHLAQDDPALRAAWDAARGGDWRPARDLMATTRSDFDRRARYVWVLAESVTAEPGAGVKSDPNREVGAVDTTAAWTDRWAAAEPENADAVLLRARSLITRAWEVRGGSWASFVGPDAAAEFHRLLLLALPVGDKAAMLAPEDPTPWAQRLLLATALGASRADFERTWSEVIAREPLHREAHNFRLMYLCLKWRGSHEEMFAFARAAAAAAPFGSPLHVLPLHAAAEWAMWEFGREGSFRNILKVTDVLRSGPEFHADLDNALNRWFATAPGHHAMWYHDLNYLAYALVKANRHADAKAVFEAIGPYMENIPWVWMEPGNPEKGFRGARRRALRG